MTQPLEVEFRQWVQNNARTGVNGFDKEEKYVSDTQLADYWSPTNLYEILSTIEPPLAVPVDTIRQMYLRIFSILVFIGKLGNISLFSKPGINDNNLPLGPNHLLPEWHGCLDEFLEEQWQFCPWAFPEGESNERQLPARQILPIRYEVPVAREGWISPAARINVVNIDDDYCQSIPRVSIITQDIVFSPDGWLIFNRKLFSRSTRASTKGNSIVEKQTCTQDLEDSTRLALQDAMAPSNIPKPTSDLSS